MKRSPEEILPDILAAAGCAAAYCGDPEVWPLFEGYLRDHGALNGDELIVREFMDFVSYFLLESFRNAEVAVLEKIMKENKEL